MRNLVKRSDEFFDAEDDRDEVFDPEKRSDVFDAEKRSDVMRQVKSEGTEPEMKVRRAVHAMGLGHRLGGWGLPGKPDLVFPGRRKAIFVHGCFWHGHDCKRGARAPKDNAQYWSGKIGRNRARDERVLDSLRGVGWDALTIWECELKDESTLKLRLESFLCEVIADEKYE